MLTVCFLPYAIGTSMGTVSAPIPTKTTRAVGAGCFVPRVRAGRPLNIPVERSQAEDGRVHRSIGVLQAWGAFLASTGGFRFTNSWQSEPAVTLRTPFGVIDVGIARGGLSGGMVFAALDYWYARQVPSVQTAFDMLRTVSQNRNVPLRQVATDLVTATVNPASG